MKPIFRVYNIYLSGHRLLGAVSAQSADDAVRYAIEKWGEGEYTATTAY